MLQPSDLRGRRAISYTRWSSDKQNDNDSLRRQTAAAREFCGTYGLTLAEDIVDRGVSAFKGRNLEQGLGRFISAVGSGEVPKDTVLLLEAIDRFSRQNYMDARDRFEALLKLGITIVTLIDRQVHTWEAYRENIFLAMQSLMAMKAANDYSAKISERVGGEWNNRASRARKGKVRMSKVPFWIDQETQQLNDRADQARLIFRLASDDVGQSAITQRLNLEGIPSPRGGQWGKSVVQDVLKSKTAYGSLVIKGDEVRDYYPALITETDWLAIQHRTKARANNPQVKNTANLFSRLISCAHCGSVMNLSTARFGKFRYLICDGKTTKRTDCTAPNWRYDVLENEVLGRVGFLAVPIPGSAARVDNTGQLADAIRELEAKRKNVLDGVASGDFDAASRTILADQAKEIGTKIEGIKRLIIEQQERNARAVSVAEAAADFSEDIEKIRQMAVDDRAGAQRLIANLIEKIELESDSKELRRANVTLRSGHTPSIVFDTSGER